MLDVRCWMPDVGKRDKWGLAKVFAPNQDLFDIEACLDSSLRWNDRNEGRK